MSAREFAEARRVMTGVTASLERRCLLWLAARLPRWMNSDHLTVLALFAMLMTGVSYYVARGHRLALLLAIVWLAVNWFGDSLDGTLALLFDPTVEILGRRYGLFDVGGLVATLGISVTLMVSVIRNVRALYRAEPLPGLARADR